MDASQLAARFFTVFQQVDGKTRKVVARYQQFRAIHKAVVRLRDGRSRARGAKRDERGGIIWHTQGSGKSLSMVFLVRKMRMMPRPEPLQGGAGYRPYRSRKAAPRDGAMGRPCDPMTSTPRYANRQPPAPSASCVRPRPTSCSPCCKSIRTCEARLLT